MSIAGKLIGLGEFIRLAQQKIDSDILKKHMALYSAGMVYCESEVSSLTFIRYDGIREYYTWEYDTNQMTYKYNPKATYIWTWASGDDSFDYVAPACNIPWLNNARIEIITAEAQARHTQICLWTQRMMIMRDAMAPDIITYLIAIIARFLPWSYLASQY